VYLFYLRQWQLGLSAERIDTAVAKGYLTAEQGEAIKATPR
jgi:hypothetical protein